MDSDDQKEMRSLFERCTSVVLGSPYLLDRASIHLPHRIGGFLLYLALETRNQLAVRKLVEKWPHPELTLDFLSNPLCRRHRGATPHCLEPHEYMGVLGSYARNSSHENVSGLLEGVFYNLYLYSSVTGGGLRAVDMAALIVDGQQIPLLLNLVNGEVPVTHCRDYITDKEAQTMGVVKPRLKSKSGHKQPLILCLNLMLGSNTSKQNIAALVEVCSQHQWVQVNFKGINIFSLSSKALQILPLHRLLSPVTEHLYLSESCSRELAQLGGFTNITAPCALWVSCNVVVQAQLPRIPSNCTALLLANQQRSHNLATQLSLLSAARPRELRAFCLLRQRVEHSDVLRKGLGALLVSISDTLEYLQLNRWRFSMTDLESLLQCSRLRALCITEECRDSAPHHPLHSASDIFVCISKLPHLEFFQWSESINLTTAGLLSLYHLLCNSVTALQHFHVCFPLLLLSTTDLENESYSPLRSVLLPLLQGKKGDESCTTFMFSFDNEAVKKWLLVLRPTVCFRLGKPVECVTELRETATVYDHMF